MEKNIPLFCNIISVYCHFVKFLHGIYHYSCGFGPYLGCEIPRAIAYEICIAKGINEVTAAREGN